MDVTSIAAACADLRRAEHAERERKYPERLYRAVSRAIDQACVQVEAINLNGGGGCPSGVGPLVEYLQLLAGEPVARPSTSVEALATLFQLGEVLLGRGVDVDSAPRLLRRSSGRAA